MKNLIATILLVLAYNLSFGQCIFGDCKNGYGRLKVENRLFCGNFIDSKLNGEVFIAEALPQNLDTDPKFEKKKYINKWLSLCIENYENGKPQNQGKFLFKKTGFNYSKQVINEFSTDTRDYLEYYEGPINEFGYPNGVGMIFTENIFLSPGGKKKVIGDSVVYTNGKIIIAKSYEVLEGDGKGVYYNATFDNSPWKNYENNALWKVSSNEALIPWNYVITGTIKIFYDFPKKNVLKQEGVCIRECIRMNGVNRENNSYQLKAKGIIKTYTPDGTLVSEYDPEKSNQQEAPASIKCISGDCVNGNGKMILKMMVGRPGGWYTDGNPKRYKMSTSNSICVFQGKFNNGKPIGIFKMWNTDGYDFTGELNDDFSLKQGKFNIIGENPISYQGTFGPNSEPLGGVIKGPYGSFRITKERAWVQE